MRRAAYSAVPTASGDQYEDAVDQNVEHDACNGPPGASSLKMIQFFEHVQAAARVLRPRVSREHRRAAAPDPRRVPGAARAVQAGEHPGHGGVLRIGARAQPRSTPSRRCRSSRRSAGAQNRRARAALKRSRKAVEWSRYYEDARELAHRLTVEPVARGAAPPLRRLLRRRARASWKRRTAARTRPAARRSA